ncbi:meiosis initiator protein isoform X2 [Hyla sarda]|uniref:meiosis initiator protein isoform X2 n=1 Tax=Hyla sarda TaxID=327740 RepID=UPI0024C27C2D|nr:meiosis initiator protein isoform X2 [Hyla sarda]
MISPSFSWSPPPRRSFFLSLIQSSSNMAKCRGCPVSAASSGSRPRAQSTGAPRGRHSVDMVELAMILPGSQRKVRGAQNLLVSVISYIQFLQRRIQETQSRLIPHSSRQGFLPLWTPRHSADITCKRSNGGPEIRRRQRPRGSDVKPKQKFKPKSKRTLQQRLVPYISSSSSSNGDGSPWLVSIFPDSPISPCTPQSSVAPLELSPLLLSPPADDLHHGLFEEVQIDSSSSDGVQDSDISLGRNYSSCAEKSYVRHPQPTQEIEALANCWDLNHQPPGEDAEGSGFRRCLQVNGAKGKAKRVQAHSTTSREDNVSPGEKKLKQRPHCSSRLQQLRKKCVNGFIMFCRLNRRPYLSAHPGKASTTATKDLAELWKLMSARERRPYCVRALQFSLLHDRMVRSSQSKLPHESVSPPKPVSVLLEEKAAQLQEYVDPNLGPQYHHPWTAVPHYYQ